MPQQQEKIGEGAFSVVSRPKNKVGERSYIIKRPNPLLPKQKSQLLPRKYRHQKQVVDILHREHPEKSHLFGQIYQVDDRKGQSIMKDLGDMNLMDVINRKWHRLSCQIDRVMEQLTDAVVAILGSGVVHRDIKPENIMVRYDDETGHFHLTFVDFTDALTKENWNRSKNYIDFGTAEYMSPGSFERIQKRNWKKPSWNEYVANDLWSLGVVMYILLYREHPVSMFRRLHPNIHFSSLPEFYEMMLENPRMYKSIFSLEKLPIHKHKNYQDVVALLSLDPNDRLNWFKDKIRKQKQQQEKTRDQQAVPRLLSAPQVLGQRQKKRSKTQPVFQDFN